MGTQPRPESMTEDAFLEICRGLRPPEPEPFARGRADWEAGKQFHEGPRPIESTEALSWRLGWNDRALEER